MTGMLGTVTRFLSVQATRLLALSLFIGLGLPDLAAWMRPLLTPAVVALVFLSLLRLEPERALNHVRKPRLIALVLAWMLIASPLLMWLGLKAVDLSPGVETALILMAASPPTLSSPSLARIVGLDGPLSLVALLLAVLAVPFSLPVLSIELLNLQLSLATLDLIIRLGGLIGGTFAVALVVRRVFGAARIEAAGQGIDGALVLALVVFAIAVMDGVAAALIADPGHVLEIAAIAFAANIGFQAAGAGIFAAAGRRSALTAGFSCGHRNMGILLPALPATIWPDTLLFIAVLQFPIYMLPWASGRLYIRMLRP